MRRIEMKRAPWWERNLGWLLIAPTFVMFIFFAFLPSITAIIYAVSRVKLVRGHVSRRWIALDNFKRAFNDDLVRQSVGVTLRWMFGVTVVEIVLGLALALLLTQNIRFRGVITSIWIIPIVMPPVSVAIAWRFMYDLNWGIFNYPLGKIGIGPVPWLTDRHDALYSMMAVDVWQATPFAFLLLYAGLLALPRDPYEAAAIDGASRLHVFRTITLPLIRPILLVVVLLRLIDSARIFDKIYIMTRGGPGSSSYSTTLTIYIQAFTRFDLGYASALSFLFQLVLVVIATIYVRRVMSDYAGPT